MMSTTMNLEDDKLLVKEAGIHVIVECVFELSAFIELLQDGSEVVDVKGDALLSHDLRDALNGKLVVAVEAEVVHVHLSPLFFHTVDALLDGDEVVALNKLWHEAHELAVGGDLLTVGGSLVVYEVVELVHLPLDSCVGFLLLSSM